MDKSFRNVSERDPTDGSFLKGLACHSRLDPALIAHRNEERIPENRNRDLRWRNQQNDEKRDKQELCYTTEIEFLGSHRPAFWRRVPA